MTIRKLKKSWWVDFRVNYVRYRKRSPENTRAGAKAFEARLRHTLAQGEPIETSDRVAQRDQTFRAFAWTWFDDYVIVNNKISERRSKAYVLDASLVPFFGATLVRQISNRQIEQYKAHTALSGVSNKTINNRLTVLNKCLATAYDWLELPGKPPKITWLKSPPSRTDYLTLEECDRLLASADGVVYEMILLALRSGMRQGELKGLQWGSVDWHSQTIIVQHSKSDYSTELVAPKNYRARHIPMHPEVLAAMFPRKQSSGYVFTDVGGQPFNQQRLALRLSMVCKRAGVRHIGWHVLRHTFASQLAMGGVPLSAVQALLGHSNITMTMRYSHMAPSFLRSAIEGLAPADRRGQPVGNPTQRLQNTLQ